MEATQRGFKTTELPDHLAAEGILDILGHLDQFEDCPGILALALEAFFQLSFMKLAGPSCILSFRQLQMKTMKRTRRTNDLFDLNSNQLCKGEGERCCQEC
ncbi:Hypothetical predicted protein [Podarcis lilfordi]|nr:Hypothetical predicted protein [Podarcis lilfordi]